jgi:hypothetical protein
MLATLVATLGLAGSASAQALPDHSILTSVPPIMIGRVDPIIDPGQVAAHVHTVLGASNFRCEFK